MTYGFEDNFVDTWSKTPGDGSGQSVAGEGEETRVVTGPPADWLNDRDGLLFEDEDPVFKTIAGE